MALFFLQNKRLINKIIHNYTTNLLVTSKMNQNHEKEKY